jgi:hypothetical protein
MKDLANLGFIKTQVDKPQLVWRKLHTWLKFSTHLLGTQ